MNKILAYVPIDFYIMNGVLLMLSIALNIELITKYKRVNKIVFLTVTGSTLLFIVLLFSIIRIW